VRGGAGVARAIAKWHGARDGYIGIVTVPARAAPIAAIAVRVNRTTAS